MPSFTVATGIALAFVSMLCWGFGDFLIQRSARKIGDWETLFIITFFGALILLPFVWKNIPGVFTDNYGLVVLMLASVIIFVAALIDFEALKKGKLAIVEPIWAFEIPAASFLAFFILGERITFVQGIFVAMLMLGLIMVSIRTGRGGTFDKKTFFEKGTLLAFIGAITMGSANFFIGWGSRVSDPVMVIFFTNLVLAILCFIYLLSKNKVGQTFVDARKNFALVMPMTVFDNVAWVAYAFSMALAPIAIATALSESYVILAVLLGIFINKERLFTHQKVGLIVTVVAAIVLAVVTSN